MTDSTKMLWRVGSHYGIHIYAVTGPNTDDIPVGTMLTVALAQEAVTAHNAAIEYEAKQEAAADPWGAQEAEPWWRHHPDHMKGWEAFGVTGNEPTVRQLGTGYNGKGKPGTDPWGPGEVKLGVGGVEFSTHADCPTGAYLYVVGTERDDVERRWRLADTAWRTFGPTLWPKSRVGGDDAGR